MRALFKINGASRALPALIAVGCYMVFFAPIRSYFGDGVGSLSVIPVLVAGTYLSRKATWAVALGLTLLNGFLFATIATNPSPGREWYGSLLGTISLFVTADLVGRARDARVRLKHSGESKDEFLAGVSHELRTPLTAVVGYSSLLRSESTEMRDVDREVVVELIYQQASDMAGIVEDLLVGTRLDTNELTFSTGDVQLIGEVEKSLDALSRPVGYSLTVAVPSSSYVIGDADRIRQILRNLVTNAYRHGGPEISVEAKDEGTMTRLSVRDNGTPLPRDEWISVFEPYYRSHSQQGQPDSVGLGLTVSRKLARAMDGDLRYRGGDGFSEFSLVLPTAWPARLARQELEMKQRTSLGATG
jgi:signal transduction histidine kinase